MAIPSAALRLNSRTCGPINQTGPMTLGWRRPTTGAGHSGIDGRLLHAASSATLAGHSRGGGEQTNRQYLRRGGMLMPVGIYGPHRPLLPQRFIYLRDLGVDQCRMSERRYACGNSGGSKLPFPPSFTGKDTSTDDNCSGELQNYPFPSTQLNPGYSLTGRSSTPHRRKRRLKFRRAELQFQHGRSGLPVLRSAPGAVGISMTCFVLVPVPASSYTASFGLLGWAIVADRHALNQSSFWLF